MERLPPDERFGSADTLGGVLNVDATCAFVGGVPVGRIAGLAPAVGLAALAVGFLVGAQVLTLLRAVAVSAVALRERHAPALEPVEPEPTPAAPPRAPGPRRPAACPACGADVAGAPEVGSVATCPRCATPFRVGPKPSA